MATWFDRKILRVKEPEPSRVPFPSGGQVEPEKSVRPPVSDNPLDYDAGGSEKAKAFIKVWEIGVNLWAYEVTVIYKGQKETYTSLRPGRTFNGLPTSLPSREQNWSEASAKKNAEKKASILARQLRIRVEPQMAEYEVEL